MNPGDPAQGPAEAGQDGSVTKAGGLSLPFHGKPGRGRTKGGGMSKPGRPGGLGWNSTSR